MNNMNDYAKASQILQSKSKKDTVKKKRKGTDNSKLHTSSDPRKMCGRGLIARECFGRGGRNAPGQFTVGPRREILQQPVNKTQCIRTAKSGT
jgi:hypothetical protein